jgi:hypothetical protein
MSVYEGKTYKGDWIPLDPDDEGPARAEEPIDHHKYWDKALHSARDKVRDGNEGPFRVERWVTIKHGSPGWVDGYRIDLGT